MKGKVLLLALAVSALVLIVSGISYAEGSYENPAPGTFQTTDLQGPPGSHSGAALNRYDIGLRDKGDYCSVETIKAESSEQALNMAKNLCPTCRVQDVTGRKIMAPAPPSETVPMSVAFCNRKLYNPESQ